MIIIALPNRVKNIKCLADKDAKWCYLGKDIARRGKISKALGEERRFFLSSRLQKKVEELGQSYIEYIARVGKVQRDQLNWWASKFASKRFMHTDFFLLVCYKAIAADLIRERASYDKLIIFIEDLWLFKDVKNLYCHMRDIKFVGSPKILFIKTFYLIRGIIHRFLLLAWVPLGWWLIKYYHKGAKPKALQKGVPAIGIINPAEKRAFRDGNYVDNYLPDLAAFYEKNGIDSFHIYLVRFPLSTAKYVGINKDILWPLILDIKFSSAIKRILDYWRPTLDINASNHIGGNIVSNLIDREWWLELSSAGFNVHLILFDTLDYFFQKGWCRSVIYTFENQPWEKMLCMAANKNGIRTIGYQHSSIWRLYLAQFIGRGEEAFVPLPHRLITSGAYTTELYKRGGMPHERLVIGGAWRYRSASGVVTISDITARSPNSKPVILVALSLDISISRSMLENISKIISTHRLNDEIELLVKPHPGNTPYELGKLKALISRYKTVNESFSTLLKDVDIVVSSESTTGLEAFLRGKKAVSYIPENLLASDPLLDITDDRVYKWYEGEAIDIDFLKDSSAPVNKEDINTIRRRYFDEIDYKTWLACAET